MRKNLTEYIKACDLNALLKLLELVKKEIERRKNER